MADQGLVLGVDVGSHGVRCVCGPHTGSAHYQGPPPPAPRMAQQWVEAFESALAQIPADAIARIEAVGITGMRGSFVALDADMKPLGPAAPDFDAGAIPAALDIKIRFGDAIVEGTGCPPFPISGLPKLVKLAAELGERPYIVFSPQDFLAWYLTGRTRTSVGAALRLGCLDIAGTSFASALLADLGIRAETLPELVPIGGIMGEVTSRSLPQGVPVIAMPGDGPAAWAAAGAGDHGLISLGTTTVSLLPADGVPRLQGDVTLELNPYGGRLLEYGSGIGGAAIDWLSNLTGLAPQELEARSQSVGNRVPQANPAFLSAWGAPPGASFSGIFLQSGPAEMAASLFDAIARDAVNSIRLLSAKGQRPTSLYLTGGCARSARVVDLIRRETALPIHLAGDSELAAIGAAMISTHYLGKSPA